MIDIEQEKPTKKKSFLEKIAPFIFILLIVFVAFFVFNKFFNTGSIEIEEQNNQGQELEQREIKLLIDFIDSKQFTDLVYTPDPSIFDPVN